MFIPNETVRSEFIGRANAPHSHHIDLPQSHWLRSFIDAASRAGLPHDRLILSFNTRTCTFDLCWWINKPGIDSGVPSHRVIHRMEFHPDIDAPRDSIEVALRLYLGMCRRGRVQRVTTIDDKLHAAIADSDAERRDRVRTYRRRGYDGLAEMYAKTPMPYVGKAERDLTSELRGS